MEQKQYPKLSNDQTLVIKPAGKGRAVVILSTGHYQSMIIQHLLDENIYKKLDPCIDNTTQSNFLRFRRQYKMCFTEREWKLQMKQHEISNFSLLSNIYKSKIIEFALNTQNSKINEASKPKT